MGSVLGICPSNIYIKDAGIMHEVGYVYLENLVYFVYFGRPLS